jgi:hypothetical protein
MKMAGRDDHPRQHRPLCRRQIGHTVVENEQVAYLALSLLFPRVVLLVQLSNFVEDPGYDGLGVVFVVFALFVELIDQLLKLLVAACGR